MSKDLIRAARWGVHLGTRAVAAAILTAPAVAGPALPARRIRRVATPAWCNLQMNRLLPSGCKPLSTLGIVYKKIAQMKSADIVVVRMEPSRLSVS